MFGQQLNGQVTKENFRGVMSVAIPKFVWRQYHEGICVGPETFRIRRKNNLRVLTVEQLKLLTVEELELLTVEGLELLTVGELELLTVGQLELLTCPAMLCLGNKNHSEVWLRRLMGSDCLVDTGEC
jgi:hypothetical protein